MTSLIRGAKLDKLFLVLDTSMRSRAGDTLDSKSVYPNSGMGEVHAQLSPEITESQELESDTSTSIAFEQFAFGESFQAEHDTAPIVPSVQSYEIYKEQFNEELSQLRAEAVDQGYSEGLQAGSATAMQESAQGREQLSTLIDSMRAEYERDLDGIAEIGAEIVFEAVTRIIGSSYMDRVGVTAVVRQVITYAKDRSRLVIRVSPGDYQELNAAHDLVTENGNSHKVEILADDRVELGGCLLETPAGNLDGRLEVQLQQLRDTLLSARLRRSESVLQP